MADPSARDPQPARQRPRALTAGRLSLLWAGGVAAWAVVATLLLCVGSTGPVGWPAGITLDLRLERVLTASLVGAALAGAGVGYQAVLRNPLADPYLLGASSGAALAAYAWTLPFAATLAWTAVWGQQAFAFAGAASAVGIVLLLAGGTGRLDPVRAVLVGVIVSTLCGGIFVLLVYLYREPAGGGVLGFLFGAIRDQATPGQRLTVAATTLLGLLALAWLAAPASASALGEDEAAALGVNVNRIRWVVLGVASLMTASAVAASGPIGFVGLICPHLARLGVGSDVRRVLPVAAVLGAVLLAGSDAASRLLAREINTVLPVGVLTNLLGGPFFLFLLYARRGRV